jgi:Cd2+/Zn2+-exporting ATPase
METADITLMNGSFYQLPFAIKLSHATLWTIKVNVALSLLVKFAFLCLVLVGVGTMWMAVFADTGLSLLVILNGLRLAKKPSSP